MSIFTTDESRRNSDEAIRTLQRATVNATEYFDRPFIEAVVDDALTFVKRNGTEATLAVLADYTGFTFTKPSPPIPRKFFAGVDTSTLYEKTIEVGAMVKVVAVLHGATDAARFIGWTGKVTESRVGKRSKQLLYSVFFKSGETASYFRDEIEVIL